MSDLQTIARQLANALNIPMDETPETFMGMTRYTNRTAGQLKKLRVTRLQGKSGCVKWVKAERAVRITQDEDGNILTRFLGAVIQRSNGTFDCYK